MKVQIYIIAVQKFGVIFFLNDFESLFWTPVSMVTKAFIWLLQKS